MDAGQFIEALYQEAKKANTDEFQIKYYSRNEQGISLVDGELETADNSESQVVQFDVRKNGKIGRFVYEGAFDVSVLPLIVREAQDNVLLINDEDDDFFYDGKAEYQQNLQPYMPLWDKLNSLDKVEFLKKIEKLAYDKSNLVNKVIRVAYMEVQVNSILRNSLGLNVSKKNVHVMANVELSVQKDNEIKDAYEVVDFSKNEHFNPQYLVDKVVENAVLRLGGHDFETGKYKVVLKNRAMKRLLTIITKLFFAQSIIDNETKFGDKVGQKLAADDVTIIENPFMVGGHATSAFDGEGYPTSYKEIVKNGVLHNLLYGLKTANRFNTISSGNGGFLGNLYLQNGEHSFEQLLSKVGDGVLIERLSGFNVGVDKVSGDFSLVGGGRWVKNGQVAEPLTPFTVSGNLYQLLQDIVWVGNDLDFHYGSYGSPSVVVEENISLANS